MKRKQISIFLCLLLISLQIFTVGHVARADNDLEVTSEVSGMVNNINNQYFVSSMNPYSVNYKIKNISQSEVRINQILENGQVIKDFTSEGQGLKLAGGASMTQPQAGSTFYGDLENNPGAVEYAIKYSVLDAEGNTSDRVKEGYTYVHVIEVDFNAKYSADKKGPIFKGDQVTLEAEIQSISNVTLYNLAVVDKDLNLEIGTIEALNPGKKAKVQKTVNMDKATTGTLLITYDDPIGYGPSLTKTVSTDLGIQIKDGEPVSSLSVSGKTNKNKIPGETAVNFEMTIKNTGNTVLTELKCFDWNDKEFYTHASLQPGEEITVSHTENIEPGKSYELLVQARVESSNQLIKSTWSKMLDQLKPEVEIQRSLPGDSILAGEPFILEYVLRNTGNVDLKDIEISESFFGEITSIDSLASGQEIEFSKELTLDENNSSKTLLTALDTETNKEYSYESSEMEFLVEDEGEGLPEQALSIILQTEKDTMTKAGTVEMECIIENTGQKTLYNLILTLVERDMVIDNISELEPGIKKTILVPAIRVAETETFTVEANGLGEDGQKFSTVSQPLTIKFEEGSFLGKFNILRVVLVIIILICIFVIGVLIYTLKGSPELPFKKKKKKKQASES